MSQASSLERHKAQCSICRHEQKAEIERLYLDYVSPDKIVSQIPGISRDAVYRHAEAVKLSERKGRNLVRYIDKLLDKGMEGIEDNKIPMTAQALASFVQLRAKINSQGEWVDKIETLDKFKLVEDMTEEEAAEYADSGRLPERLWEKWGALVPNKGAIAGTEEAE